ncbi:MAG: AbrB/MazE/SpoVT family DNA-binding domain-containing protein [Propionibacteriaceae bacterium]|nr:AbrB/MazE/SpoVT family DNA-binding domain-containing protein [Propionibacteriaceae bacterium]
MTIKNEQGSFPWQHVPRPGKIYGAATVGERGQISLPAEARRELGIEAGDKVMVFANRLNGSMVLVKADVFENFADFFMTKLNKLEATAQGFFDTFMGVEVDEDETDSTEESEPGVDSQA